MIFPHFSTFVTDGIKLYFACVLPTLFPYLFITAVLSSLSVTKKISKVFSPITSKLFLVNGCVGYALLLSVMSGYPVGAKMVSDLKNNGYLSTTEAQRASTFCSTPSPMFLIASVGAITFNNKNLGAVAFAVTLLSALITGIIFSFYHRKEKPITPTPITNGEKNDLFFDSVYSAVISVLVVGGIITLFYTFTEILLFFKLLAPIESIVNYLFGNQLFGKGIALGLFECTKGLKGLAVSGASAKSLLPIICALCSFGGLSVIFQSISYLKKAKLKTAPFVFSKLLSAVISYFLGLVFSFLV